MSIMIPTDYDNHHVLLSCIISKLKKWPFFHLLAKENLLQEKLFLFRTKFLFHFPLVKQPLKYSR